jgi:putative membrane protein
MLTPATQSNDPRVRAYGTDLIEGHRASDKVLQGVADSNNLDLPQEPDGLHQEMKEMLSGLSGLSYDTSFMQLQITDHRHTMLLFRTEVEEGKSATVVQYAREQMPILEVHLNRADTLIW